MVEIIPTRVFLDKSVLIQIIFLDHDSIILPFIKNKTQIESYDIKKCYYHDEIGRFFESEISIETKIKIPEEQILYKTTCGKSLLEKIKEDNIFQIYIIKQSNGRSKKISVLWRKGLDYTDLYQSSILYPGKYLEIKIKES